jgi:hypothetical protein
VRVFGISMVDEYEAHTAIEDAAVAAAVHDQQLQQVGFVCEMSLTF